MGVQVCKRSEQKKMELNANIQLVINSYGTLFPDKIFSLTCFKFPNISRFSRQVVTLSVSLKAGTYRATKVNFSHVVDINEF